MRVVLGFDANLAAVDFAFGDGNAGHGQNAPGGTKQPGKAGETIDAEVEQTAATRLVKPFAPRRTRPSVAGACRTWLADVAAVNAPSNGLERRAENRERRADQITRAAGGEFGE